MMNLSQTKLVGLTMELELKTREYKNLCDKLDKLKEKKIEPNDERLIIVKELFQKNNDEITKINMQIKELKEKQKVEQYNPDNLFKKDKDISSNNLPFVESKKNIFVRLIEKIKAFFQKT